MKKPRKPIVAPICCGKPARLTGGGEIYPNRPDLSQKRFYKCDRCRGYCGCHPGTTRSLGTPAGPALRRARSTLHDNMVDPLWKNAVEAGGYTPENERAAAIIRSAARGRVYAYLAHHLGIERGDCHTAMFSIEQCRDAWRALRGRTYPEIRDWYKARHPKQEAQELGSSEPLGPLYDGTTMDNQQLHGTTRRNQPVVTAGETAPLSTHQRPEGS